MGPTTIHGGLITGLGRYPDRHCSGNSMRVWLTFVFLALCGHIHADASASRGQIHQAEVGPYIVYWHLIPNGPTRDEVEILERNKRETKSIYRYIDSTGVGIMSVTRWHSPSTANPEADGLLLEYEGYSGTSRTFAIIARTSHGFRPVFHAISRNMGDEHVLEMVDLNSDGEDEVILVPDYLPYSAKREPSTAQVWRWSPKEERYNMVRESAFRDRLKPLATKAKQDAPLRVVLTWGCR